MFGAIGNGIFHFFTNFRLKKLKQFPGKAKESLPIYLNPKFVKQNILINGFDTTLRWKTNILRVQLSYFLRLCKFLSDEVETIGSI